MTMENPRALIKIKESGDSCSFYLRFFRGVWIASRERTDLFGERGERFDSIVRSQSYRGGRLFIGRKTAIILARSALFR